MIFKTISMFTVLCQDKKVSESKTEQKILSIFNQLSLEQEQSHLW